MKRIVYQGLYRILAFLSNRFDNKHLKKYKIVLGTSLLVLTSACQSPKKDSPGEVSCYEMPAEYEDTINIQSRDSSEILHNVTTGTQVSAPYDSIEVTCYIIDVLEPEVPVNSNDLLSEEDENFVFTVVERMPRFPGGDEALINYMQEKIEYPSDALKRGYEGRVLVSFVIEKDGSISSAEVLRGIVASLDEEALRIIRGMPKWEPGRQNDKEVSVKYTLPVRFTLPK